MKRKDIMVKIGTGITTGIAGLATLVNIALASDKIQSDSGYVPDLRYMPSQERAETGLRYMPSQERAEVDDISNMLMCTMPLLRYMSPKEVEEAKRKAEIEEKYGAGASRYFPHLRDVTPQDIAEARAEAEHITEIEEKYGAGASRYFPHLRYRDPITWNIWEVSND